MFSIWFSKDDQACSCGDVKTMKKSPLCSRAMPGALSRVPRCEFLRANISILHKPRAVVCVCVCVHIRTCMRTRVTTGDAIPPFFRSALDPRVATTALSGLADRRRSGNVAGGIDSAPQPQPHVCRRAAMIPKPCWPCNGFSAVTRKPLPTTRHDNAGRATRQRLFRLLILIIHFRVLYYRLIIKPGDHRGLCDWKEPVVFHRRSWSLFRKFELSATNSKDYFASYYLRLIKRLSFDRDFIDLWFREIFWKVLSNRIVISLHEVQNRVAKRMDSRERV